MKIYALGGLGADKRTFNYLKLQQHELICLDWITPEKDDSLADYAKRINDLIPVNENEALLGVSFGGMIMTEVSKLRNPKHTILISSVSHKDELRWAYRQAGKLKLDKMVPYSLMVKSGRLVHYLFGVKLMRDKELLGEILQDMDANFLKWAIGVITRWDNESEISSIRIHGTRDRVLPIPKSKIDYPFEGDGHFIIVNKGEEISEILDELH